MHPTRVKDLVTGVGQMGVEMLAPSLRLYKMVIRMNLHQSLSVQDGVHVVDVVEATVGVVRPAHRNQKPRQVLPRKREVRS